MKFWVGPVVLVLAVFAIACGRKDRETRAETRGLIAGQVVLANIAGLDDPSRVRVDIGAGEGGVSPDEDGSFVFADIEADLYELTVTYEGGLTSEASDSGYQPYSVQVPMPAGGSVHLGRIELVLGVGTVHGNVTGWEGAPTTVKLRSDDVVREVPVLDGEYVFENVPVGRYDLRIVAEGSGQSGCGGGALVAFHGDDVLEDLPVSGTPALSPGQDEVVDQSGSEWRVAGTSVSVNLDRHMPLARAWEADDDQPDYAEFDPGEIPSFSFDKLTEGTTEVFVQWTDVCGVESEPYPIMLVRDLNPPVVSEPEFGKTLVAHACTLSSGEAYRSDAALPITSSNAVPMTLFADDAETTDRSRLTMKYTVCDRSAPATLDCDPEIDEASLVDYELLRSIAFDKTPGLKVVQVVVVDPSGNESEVVEAQICFDPDAPTDITLDFLDIGEDGVIHTPTPTVTLLATGATWMKVGTTPGLGDVAPEPYQSEFVFAFPPGDGDKTLYVQLGDDAGNWTEEYSKTVTLDTSASVAGSVRLGAVPSDGDHSGVEVAIIGTPYSTTTDASGAFLLTGVPAAPTSTFYQLEAHKAGYSPQRVPIALAANQDLVLTEPILLLEVDTTPPDAMQVVIEDGSGIIRDPSAWIYVSGTGATQMKVGTTSGLATAGWQPIQDAFVWDFTPTDGVKRLYSRFRDDAGNETDEIVAEAVLNTKGVVSGRVVLFGESDHSGAQVALLGTSFSTTTDADGLWAIEEVPAGTYNIEITKQSYRTHRENGFFVVAAQENDVGEVVLDAYQAKVIGQVVLEGWEGTLNHSGAYVSLPHPNEAGVVFDDYTDAAGNFTLYVEPTNYPDRLTISKTGYETYEHPTTFSIGPDDTFNIGLVRLDASANDLIGNVRLAGHSDHSGITVTAAGINGERTEGELFETTTDAFGDYLIEGLPIGPYRVRYVYEPEAHRETYAADLEIEPGPPTRIDSVTLRDRYLVIADGADRAASQLVSVQLGASDCLEQRVSNDSADFADPDFGWGPCVNELVDWDLGSGDGTKTVYAQFKVQSDPSNPTDTVSDSITLDTVGTITAFTHDGDGRVLGAGAVLRLTLVGEPGGRAHAVIGGGYDDNVTLYDDGSRGDDVAGDGVYRRSYTIVRSDDVTGVSVTGYFTDSVGNDGFLVAPDPVTISVPPLIQSVSVVPDPGAGTVTIQWQTDEAAHGSVLWGPEAEPVVYTHTDSEPAGYATTHAVTVGPADIVPGDTYHFQVQVADASGASSSTHDATFRLVHAQPRYVVAIPGIDRNHVRWEASSMDPVWGYNVYRRVDGQEFDLDSPINPEPCGWTATDPRCNSEAWFYEDDLVDPGTTFHYAVAAVDPMGHVGVLSDETSATPCVASSGPTSVQGDIEGTTVWSECGSPYRMTGSVAVGKNVDGSILVLGPNTNVTAMGSYQLMIRTLGRIVALGERGAVSWDETAGEYVESDDGMVSIEASSGAVGAWRGVYFEFPNDGVVDDARLVDLENGEYYGGPIFYRTRISHANESGIRVYERGIAAVRSTIQNNRAGINSSELGSGGGIFIGNGQLLLRWSTISQNAAGTGTGSGGNAFGGGIAATGSTCTIMDSRIAGNSVTGATWRHGGGMAVYQGSCSLCGTSVSSPKTMLVRTRLEGNSLGTGSHASSGGGLYHWPAATTGFFLMQACVVYANTNSSNSNDSDGGGGILLAGSSARVAIVDSLFERNSAARFGGALLVEGSLAYSLAGNTFVDNATAVARSAGDIHAYYSDSVRINASTHLRTSAFTGSGPMIRSTEYPGSSVSSSHVTVPSGQNGICVGYMSAVGNSSVAPGDTAHAMMTDLAYSNPDINAHGNYWGPHCTAEMEAGGNPKNVSCIYDYYDDISLAEVEYTDYALTAFPMPRVTAPRWWHKYEPLDSITFEGYGYDYEDAADLGCGEPDLAGGMWVSEGDRYACTDADHDHWSCHRCPLDGPEYCPPECYLGDSDLRWCKTEDDCDGPNELGWGQTLSIPASSVGSPSSTPCRIWLWAYDSNGQIGKVPTEVIVQ